jgi:predicted permease
VDRKREIAVRLAIGAGRRRVVTQLCTETLLLSAMGGAGGFILSQWAVDLLLRLQPQTGFAFTLDTTPDIRVLLFTLAVVSLAGLLFGLVPALAATRTGISPTLKGEGPAGSGRGRLGLGGGLVALQMTVSIILLTGAGLFSHSLLVARNTDPGFSTEDAVSVWINLEISGLPPAEWSQVTEALQEGTRAMPGIQLLGATGILPLLNSEVDHVQIPGLDPPEGRDSHGIDIYRIDEGYLDVLEIPLLSGRGIEVGDRANSEPVVLVSQEAARRFWPGESPLGKEIVSRSTDVSYRVVGVVDDVTSVHLSENPQPAIYYSLAQRPGDDVYLVARGTGSHADVIGALRRAVREVDPDLLILLGQTMKERLGVNLYPARIAALFLGAFGMLALVLAAIGLYGVVSLSVSRRTREMGIRMAVGADAGSVVGMVLRGSLVSVGVGAVMGLGLALVGARLIRTFLFGVEPADPATLVAVPLLLGTVAAAAALIPAMRASRVDPVEALRTE